MNLKLLDLSHDLEKEERHVYHGYERWNKEGILDQVHLWK